MDKPGYFDRLNPDLLALIPPDAKVVLEIGCGTGKLCEAYRRVNPGVKWYGIEKNHEAYKAAINITDSCYWNCMDIELNHENSDGIHYVNAEALVGNLTTNQNQTLDCLIFGDVLEHLRDPLSILKILSAGVRASGQILACIPNVGHWTVIRDLLDGHWRYTDEGLLDRTHLRFFTLESIREMFDQAGLQVFEIIGRDLYNEGLKDWIDNNEWITEGTAANIPQEWRAYQYLVRAMKPAEIMVGSYNDEHGRMQPPQDIIAPIKPLHIHAIGDGTICERVRLHEPMAMLATIPGVRCTSGLGGWFNMPHPDVVIQQRFRQLDFDCQRPFIEQAIVVAEIDDDPESLQGMSDQDFAPLRAVHAIQCSTEVVAETCRKWNPHVMVFENQIADLPPWEDRLPGRIRTFFGALNREEDWKPIMPALNRVLADEIVFMVVVHDRAFYDALETESKWFGPFCQWPEYRKILRSCDIALLPLEPTRFNRHKSDLKFLECAAEGVVALMGNSVHGWGVGQGSIGCIYGLSYRFEDQLTNMIEHPTQRRDAAQNAYAYVRDHRLLSQHYRKRHAWYLELLSARQALHDDLLRRCPELDPAHAPSTTA